MESFPSAPEPRPTVHSLPSPPPLSTHQSYVYTTTPTHCQPLASSSTQGFLDPVTWSTTQKWGHRPTMHLSFAWQGVQSKGQRWASLCSDLWEAVHLFKVLPAWQTKQEFTQRARTTPVYLTHLPALNPTPDIWKAITLLNILVFLW